MFSPRRWDTCNIEREDICAEGLAAGKTSIVYGADPTARLAFGNGAEISVSQAVWVLGRGGAMAWFGDWREEPGPRRVTHVTCESVSMHTDHTHDSGITSAGRGGGQLREGSSRSHIPWLGWAGLGSCPH